MRKVMRPLLFFVVLLCPALTFAQSHSATLSWIPAQQPSGITIASWNVLRGTATGGPYTQVANIPASTTSYTDTSVSAGQNYFYVLQEVDTIGAASDDSNEVEAVIPTSPPPLAVATTSLPAATVGASYGVTISASGGTGAYTWSGTGIDGLTFSGTGLLSGTPSAAGTFTQSVTVKDSTGATSSASFTLTVAAALAISTTQLPAATAGTSYSVTLTATGGTAPYTWSGTGIDGLTFSGTGLLSGTPSAAGTFKQIVTVKDSTGAMASASLPLTVTSTSGGGTSIALMQHTSKDAGATSSSTLTFASNNTAGNWIAVCIRAGTANEIFTVTDTNGNTYRTAIQFNATVGGETMGIFYSENIAGGTNTVTVSDTALATLRFAILEYSGVATSGSLDGVAVAQGNSASPNSGSVTTTANGDLLLGAIMTAATATYTPGIGYQIEESVPAEPGTKLITEDQLQATAGAAAASASLGVAGAWAAGVAAVKVAGSGGGPAPTITSASSTMFTVGAAGSFTVTTTGTPNPSLSESGTLPTGVMFTDNGNGSAMLRGTPASGSGGIYPLTLTATNGVGTPTLQPFTLTVASAPLAISTRQLPVATAGTTYSATITASGGTGAYTWSGTGVDGLTFSATGLLSGTPSAAGTFTQSVRVKDSIGAAASASLTLTVGAPIAISTTSLPPGTAGTAYSAALIASGGTAPYTWSGAGVDGLTFSATGLLSGTPSAVGTFTQSVTVKDSTGATVTASLTLTVGAPIAISTTSLPPGAAGTAYSATLAASGGAAPYTWSGTGVDSLTFSATGLLSGTPSAAGTFTQSVMVKDSTGATATASLILTVGAPIAISTTSLPPGAAGTAYSATLIASGGTPPYTWSGTGIDGLTFSATGLLSGTPSLAGPFTQSATVKDSTGATANASLALTVTSAVSATLVSIAVTPANPSIAAGGAQQFTATGTYSDNSTQNLTSSVTWSSTNASVATIDGAGLATAIAAGSTPIQATSGTITGSTTLAVSALLSGPVGHWTFDDGAGITAVDSSGNGHTATLVNGISWVTGQIAGAISANGVNQYVAIPTIDLSTTSAVTVTFWVNRTYSTTGGHALVENSTDFNNSTTGFGLFPDDASCNGIMAGVNGNVGYSINCYQQPSSSVWHHFAVVYDKTQSGNRQTALYVDGVFQPPTQNEYTASNTNSFGNNPTYLFSQGGTQEFDAGEMDDLQIYNRALSAAEIQGSYLAGSGSPTVYIDTPVSGATVSGIVTITGWAVDNAATVGTAISSVQIKVDGTVLGTATYGLSRPDVCVAFPGQPGCPNVGYSFSLNTSTLSVGSHTITVTATDSDTTPDAGSSSVTVNVQATPPTAWIDTPKSGATVSGIVAVTGWAVDNAAEVGTTISSVQVKVDGTVVGNASYGLSRPDVCAAFPGRPGCPNVGYSYSLNTSTLSVGTHSITVTATDSDGTPDAGSPSVTVNVQATPPTVYIDAPAPGAVVSGIVPITGWAIDNAAAVGTAISSVQVKVDGTVVGSATYGFSRPDVCAAYPGRPGCPNVGYSYSLDTSTLSAGTHTITVTATDNDETPDTGFASVSVTR